MANKKWYLALFALSLFTYSNVWALITPFDPRIWERDLIQIGMTDIPQVRADLALNRDSDEVLIVRHVITTGSEKANNESLSLSIKTLERIRPQVNVYRRNAEPIALSNKQVAYVMQSLKRRNIEIPHWLRDKHQQKYLNIVLQKARSDRYSALSIADANRLLKWAVNNKVLHPQDHPSMHMRNAQ